MSVSRIELARKIAELQNLKLKEALRVVDLFFDEMTQQLVDGNGLKFSRFGNWVLRDKASRLGRNPLTGQQYEISARRVVVFNASKKIREIMTRAMRKKL